MTIAIARRLGAALGIKSESKFRIINEAILEYVRLTQQSAVTPTSGPISPDPKLASIVLVTATSFTVADQDVILVDDDAAGGIVTITLPAIATAKQYPRHIKKLGATGNVIVTGDATIDDDGQQIIASQYNSLMIIPDGTVWWIL